jgi:DNA-binding IclR family transcriptional regulator
MIPFHYAELFCRLHTEYIAMSGPTQPVKSLLRGLQLLQALADTARDGRTDIGVVELARATALSPATTHRLLATLGLEGYVAQDPASLRYRLGSRLFAVAAVAEADLATLRERAIPAMAQLRDRYGETVNLATLDRAHITYIYQVESERPLRAFNRTGNRVLAHASAAGKALLAHEPEQAVARLLAAIELPALTSATITSAQALSVELREIRQRGYAFDLGEQDEDVVCVAGAIAAPGQRPAGALSVSGPATRMRHLHLDEVGATLAGVAATILAQ